MQYTPSTTTTEQYASLHLHVSLTHSLSSFRPALYLEPMKLESLPSEHSKDSAVFVVRGITIGNTNLYFNATLPSGRVVTSSAKEVQVYSPLRLSPTHIWLVTEAVFKVWSRCIRREDTVCVCVCVCVCLCVCVHARVCSCMHVGVSLASLSHC